MKNILVGFVLLSLTSCYTGPEAPENTQPVTVEDRQTVLGKGIADLSNSKFESARDFFQKYIDKNPVSRFTPSAYFYGGLAHLELGESSQAVEKLEAAIHLTESRDTYMASEAHYQLGRAYEAAGNDDKALASYQDAERRAKYLTPEMAEVEIPARIGGVYARLGHMKQADVYYGKADDGLAKIKKRERIEKQEWIPRALYSMGKMSPRTVLESDFDSNLKSFNRSQSYLLRAIEFNHANWSKRAAQELRAIYEGAWKTIEGLPAPENEDKLAALKAQQDRMIEMALILNSSLEKLKQEFIVGVDENPQIVTTKSFVADFEKKLDALLASRPVQEGLTPEAKKLEAIRREGKVVDPKGSLEKKSQTEKK